jgi:hypothetical protein
MWCVLLVECCELDIDSARNAYQKRHAVGLTCKLSESDDKPSISVRDGECLLAYDDALHVAGRIVCKYAAWFVGWLVGWSVGRLFGQSGR